MSHPNINFSGRSVSPTHSSSSDTDYDALSPIMNTLQEIVAQHTCNSALQEEIIKMQTDTIKRMLEAFNDLVVSTSISSGAMAQDYRPKTRKPKTCKARRGKAERA